MYKIRYLIDFHTLEATGPLASLKIREQDTMVYWQSISLKFSCEMFLAFYPMDVQKCVLEFSSSRRQLEQYNNDGVYWDELCVVFLWLESFIEIQHDNLNAFCSPKFFPVEIYFSSEIE